MPDELILTTDEQLWDVLDPLLDTLKQTVATRFPEEAVAANRLTLAQQAQYAAESKAAMSAELGQNITDIIKTHQDIATTQDKLSYAQWDLPKNQKAEQQSQERIKSLKNQLSALQGDSTEIVSQRTTLTQSLESEEKVLAAAQQRISDNQKQIESANSELIVLRGHVSFLHGEADTALQKRIAQLPQDSRNTPQLEQEMGELQTSLGAALKQAKQAFDTPSESEADTVTLLGRLQTITTTLNDSEGDALVSAKAQVATYEGQVDKLKKAYSSKRDTVMQAIDKVERLKDNNASYSDIQEHLKTLAKVTPGIYGETVRDFETACNCAEHLRKEIAVREDLDKKYRAKMNSPGDTHTLNVEVEAGVGYDALIAKVRATVIIGIEVEVTKLSDGRLQAKRKLNGKINIRARTGVELTQETEAKIRAGLKGVVSVDQGRIYDSMDDFISEESRTCLAAVMSGKGGKQQRRYIDETNALVVEAERNATLLQNRLNMLGATTYQDAESGKTLTKKLKLTKSQHTDVVTSITKSAAFDASASAIYKVNAFGAGVSLGGGAQTSTTTQYRSISYLDDITEQPVLQKIYAMKNPKQMRFITVDDNQNPTYFDGQQAINELTRIEQDIAALKGDPSEKAKQSLQDYQKSLLDSIKLLHGEYDAYVTLQNVIDHDNRENAVTERIKQLRTQRGAANPAEYVKSMALQFASLRGLYENSFDAASDMPEEAKNLSQAFAEDLKIPRMKMTDSAIKNAFGSQAQTEPTIVNSFNGCFSLDAKAMGDESLDNTRAGVSFKVAASFEQKCIPKQPVQESIKLKFNTNLGAKGDNYIAQIFQIADISKRFKKEDSAAIQQELKSVFANVLDGSVEIEFVNRNGRWALKSAKGFDEQDKKLGGKVTVGTDVQLIAGLTVESKTKRLRNVYFGNNTLAALTDVYRAKHFGDAENDTNWDGFREKSTLLKRMVEQLKKQHAADPNGKSGIQGEIGEWLRDLQNNAQTDQEGAEAANNFARVWNQGQGDDGELEKALSQLVKHKTKQEDREIDESFIRRRKVERHNINDYAANQIANEMEAMSQEYQAELGEQNIKGVNDLLKRAKAAYEKEKTLRNFKLLKKAYAIDYASRELDDLVRNGDPEDQARAIAMLGGEMRNILDGDQIYLNDRLEGKLLRNEKGELQIQPVIRKGKHKTINASEITTLTTPLTKALNATTLPTQAQLKDGGTVEWKEEHYRKSAQSTHNSKRWKKSHSLRSMKTRFKWNNKISISEAISTVMQERYKKQQQQRKAALQRQRSNSGNQVGGK